MATKDEKRRIEIIADGKRAESTLKQMESAARELNAQLKKLPANSKEFADKSKELSQVKSRLTEIKNEVNGVGGVFGKVKQEIKAFGLVAMGALGFEFLTSQVRNLIAQNAKLSDSFADIRKTTGMTEQEVMILNKAFSSIDTRTSTKDLRDIAIAAGQLGIAKEDILSFTDATDKLVVSLGDEFQGGAEQVTKEMGALRNIFADIKSDNVADDMLHIGNAVNQLASAGAATGPVVADFANRIGGVGINLGLTSGQVLGLSATLQELNVSTERGGTAISKILLKMTTDTDKFANVAGVSTKEFTELVNKDLFKAFQLVSQGAKNGGASATEFGKILDDLGVDGAGASEVFSKLGANSKLLQEKVDLANGSLKNTDGIMNEFSIKNDTLAARVDKLGKTISSVFVSDTFNSWISSAIDGTQSFVNWLIKLPQTIRENYSVLVLLSGAILAYNGNLIKSKAIQLADIVLKKIGITTTILQDGATKRLTISEIFHNTVTTIKNKLKVASNALEAIATGRTIAQTIAVVAQTVATNALTFAVNLLNKAWKANPIGVVIAAVAALSAGIMALNENYEKTKELIRDAYAEDKVRKFNIQFAYTKGLIGDINKITLEQMAVREKDMQWRVNEAKVTYEWARKKKQIHADELARIFEVYKATLKMQTDLYNRKAFLLQSEIDKTKEAEDKKIEASKEAMERLKKLREEALEEYKRLVAEYNEFEDKYFFDMLSKNAQEIKSVENKYDKMIAAREKFLKNPLATTEQKQVISTEISTLGVQKQQEINALMLKQEAELWTAITKIQDDYENSRGTAFEREVVSIQDKYKTELELAKGNAVATKAINDQIQKETQDAEARYYDERFKRIQQAELEIRALQALPFSEEQLQVQLDMLDFQMQLELENVELTEKEKEAIRARYRDERHQKEIDHTMGVYEESSQIFMSFQNSTASLEETLDKNKLQKDLAKNESEKIQAKNLLDAKKITREQYEAKIQAIENQAARKRHEFALLQFEREKRMNTTKVLIETPLAIMKAIAMFGPPPSPLGIAAIAAAGVSSAAQLIAINAQEPPQFGRGGILQGDRHSDPSGGMPIINPSTGQVVAVAEGKEAIISAETTEANPEIINALFRANGRNLGLFNKPTFADTGRLFSNVASYGAGGILPGSSQQNNSLNINADAMMQAVDKFTNAVNTLVSSPIYAEISFDEFSGKMEEMRKIKKGNLADRIPDGYTKDGNVYLNDNLLS